MSVKSFAELGVSRAVAGALSRQGIVSPFAVQQLVIGDVLKGRDVLVRSPTGSGKTLAFGVPLVDRIAADGPRPAALILAPTRELATQIADDIRPVAHARALRVTAVYGGVGLVQQAERAAASHILVATPGRLEDLLARRAFALHRIGMLVLDEADRMLDMGFRPAVDRIVAACPSERQTLFFSATLDGEAGTVARHYTTDALSFSHGPTRRQAATEIEHRFVEVGAGGRVDTLVDELGRDRELTLVFVRTKHGADRLVKQLGTRGIAAVAMHGNKSQRQRERALAGFESGNVDTLVATDVAARGIDVTGISHVINFDPPHDADSYVHRVGRTGRAGRNGVGVTLVDGGERRDVAAIARGLGLEHGLPGGGSAPHEGSAPRNGPGARNGSGPRNGSGARNGSGPRNGSEARSGASRGKSRGSRANHRGTRPDGRSPRTESRSGSGSGSGSPDKHAARPNGERRRSRAGRGSRPGGSN